MPNLYGVANPVPQLSWFSTIGAANVACPAGTETNVISTTPFSALDRGIYYAVFWVQLALQIGAVAPTGVALGFRINSGADIASFGVNPSLMAINTTATVTWYNASTPSATLWVTPGSTVQLSVNPTGQAVTAIYGYSGGIFGIIRAPDQ